MTYTVTHSFVLLRHNKYVNVFVGRAPIIYGVGGAFAVELPEGGLLIHTFSDKESMEAAAVRTFAQTDKHLKSGSEATDLQALAREKIRSVFLDEE